MNDEQLEQMLKTRLDEYKKSMLTIADNALTAVYCELLPYTLGDAESNFQGLITDCVESFLKGDFKVEETTNGTLTLCVTDRNGYNHYIHNYAQNIWPNALQSIYDHAKKDVENVRIKQLEAQVESLKSQLQQSYR